ncbi:hypothetical protein GGI07_001390 [Coemansia sp. Benny D115]|nr:hypothetical protein GGI07_001390 [Coemansia sp. Benny D115]
MKTPLVHTAACWVLATTALLATAQVPGAPVAHYELQQAMLTPTPAPTSGLHKRQLLEEILSRLNPNHNRAEGDSADEEASNNANGDGEANTSDTTTESSTSTTSRNTRTSQTSETTPTSNDDEETVTSRTTQTRTSRTSTSRTTSSTDTEDDSGDSETSTTSKSSSSPTSKSTSTKSTSSMVVVTVTRPGITTTALVPPSPTIDQANGEKADVGSSGNQTTIIAASVSTAGGLALAVIIWFLYIRRKNRMRYGDEDTFAKSATKPYTPPSRPYVPANQSPSLFALQGHGNDGYVKQEADVFVTGQRLLGDQYEQPKVSNEAPNDSTQLLPPGRPYQQQPPPPQPRMQPSASFRPGPPAPGMYGVPRRQQTQPLIQPQSQPQPQQQYRPPVHHNTMPRQQQQYQQQHEVPYNTYNNGY